MLAVRQGRQPQVAHLVAAVVGGRAGGAETHRAAAVEPPPHRRRAEPHAQVGGDEVHDPHPGGGVGGDLAAGGVHHVRQPHLVVVPAHPLEDLPGGSPVAPAAELGVHTLVEVGVQADAGVLRRHLGEGGEQFETVDVRPAGGQVDADAAQRVGVVVGLDQLEAVAQHLVDALAGGLGPFPALAACVGHGAAPGVQADAHLLCGLDGGLDVGGRHAAGKEVVLVGDGRHPAQQRLHHARPRHRGDRLGREVAVVPPVHADPPEALQPVRQQGPLEVGDGAQPHLVEVLVGVDEARHDEQPGGVDDGLAGQRLEVADLGDPPAGDPDVHAAQLAVGGVEGQQIRDVAQQQSGHGRKSGKIGGTAERCASWRGGRRRPRTGGCGRRRRFVADRGLEQVHSRA